MAEIYAMDIDWLLEESEREKYSMLVSKPRRAKLQNIHRPTDMARSLGAGLLLAYGVWQAGYGFNALEQRDSQSSKPYLSDIPELHFNLSHSDKYAAAAFSSSEIGVDIEHERANTERIAERFFAENEKELLRSCTSSRQQAELFLRYWTLKESFLKVTGRGISLPMNEFSFRFEEDGVEVDWNYKNQPYYFFEYDIRNTSECADNVDKCHSRIAVCGLEDMRDASLCWVKQEDIDAMYEAMRASLQK